MKFKRPIYRILFFAAWLLVLGGLATLVIAANGKAQARTCKGVAVSINGDGGPVYVEKEDVLKAVEATAKGNVVGKRFGDINLGAFEKTLERNPWIRDAELYLDTKDVLHISVRERRPFARVFTTAGGSFFIDSSGFQLPLLPEYAIKLPVVTGFTPAKKLGTKDSLTLQGVKDIVLAVNKDSFWKAQVGQIDITPERKFELVPLIGSHVIKLGFAEDVEQKLGNLMVFYKQVLPKAGLAKYSALDAQFDGQIVAVRKGPTSVVDSVQLQKNIAELMKKKALEQEAENMPALPLYEEPKRTAPTESTQQERMENATVPAAQTNESRTTPPISTSDKTTPPKSNPPKTPIQKPEQKPPKQPIKNKAPKPKAVMPGKTNEY